MATRSTIAVQHANGTISQVYCHWDGYLEHVGKLLLQHYNSQPLAEMLVNGGSISSLGERIEPEGAHSFDNAEKGTTVFYCRDRGEELRVEMYQDAAAYRCEAVQEEFNYVFVNGVWYEMGSRDTVSNALVTHAIEMARENGEVYEDEQVSVCALTVLVLSELYG